MAGKSNIEWTGHTWNPIAGCSVLSPGCKKCYAMRLAKRLSAMGNPLYKGLTQDSSAGAVWTGEMRKAPKHTLTEPLHRKKPTTYFVNSMSDLFHEDVPDEWIDEIFAVMALSSRHKFQILTKRAARMQNYASKWFERLATKEVMIDHPTGRANFASLVDWSVLPAVLPNVWLGVSTERQQEANERIPLLLQTPAAIRFISAEPLLGPIAFHALNLHTPSPSDALRGVRCVPDESTDGYHNENTAKLDWVIVGGESGHGYRPMDSRWAEDIRDWCIASGVPFFMKQMAGKKTIPIGLFVREMPEAA